MASTTITTKKNIREIAKDFGFASEKELIIQAVEEKIMELKKLRFFAISEKIRQGLLKKKLTPDDFLKKIKS